MISPPISAHFPPMLREALVRAAKTPITEGTPMARKHAIEQVIEKAKIRYPELFKEP